MMIVMMMSTTLQEIVMKVVEIEEILERKKELLTFQMIFYLLMQNFHLYFIIYWN